LDFPIVCDAQAVVGFSGAYACRNACMIKGLYFSSVKKF